VAHEETVIRGLGASSGSREGTVRRVAVPEPATWSLIVIGLLAACCTLFWQGRSNAPKLGAAKHRL